MDTLDGIAEKLAAWATEYRLVQEAIQGCQQWFVTEGGTINGWTLADFQMVFHSHYLCFTSDLPYPYIITRLDLHTSRGEAIGQYRLITTLAGEVEDDYLVLDQSKHEYLR
jgi:hypothetical protein